MYVGMFTLKYDLSSGYIKKREKKSLVLLFINIQYNKNFIEFCMKINKIVFLFVA